MKSLQHRPIIHPFMTYQRDCEYLFKGLISVTYYVDLRTSIHQTLTHAHEQTQPPLFIQTDTHTHIAPLSHGSNVITFQQEVLRWYFKPVFWWVTRWLARERGFVMVCKFGYNCGFPVQFLTNKLNLFRLMETPKMSKEN